MSRLVTGVQIKAFKSQGLEEPRWRRGKAAEEAAAKLAQRTFDALDRIRSGR
jgi:hypothetical protein